MASVTVTSAIAGTAYLVPVNGSAAQAQFAQAIINGATSAGYIAATGAYNLSQAFTIDNAPNGSVLTQLPTLPVADVFLTGQFGEFLTGAAVPPNLAQASDSIVVAGGGTNSSIVNDNPFGILAAFTGAGGNVLDGAVGSGINIFTTGVNGSDLVTLGGALNSLTSNGADDVQVAGPSTITASATGSDLISLQSGASLNFINGDTRVGSTINAAANTTLTLAGTGATTITGSAGPQVFNIDTGAGNVSLNAGGASTDLIEFLKDPATTPSSAVITVSNFAGSTVEVHGYATAPVIGSAAAGGSTLTLGDGSSITFTSLTAAQLQAVTKVV